MIFAKKSVAERTSEMVFDERVRFAFSFSKCSTKLKSSRISLSMEEVEERVAEADESFVDSSLDSMSVVDFSSMMAEGLVEEEEEEEEEEEVFPLSESEVAEVDSCCACSIVASSIGTSGEESDTDLVGEISNESNLF